MLVLSLEENYRVGIESEGVRSLAIDGIESGGVRPSVNVR